MAIARWRLRPYDATRVQALSREAHVPPLVAQLLLNRGIDGADGVSAFMDCRLNQLHDPELLPGAVEAAERIVQAVRQGRKIVIYGDYDVDGVCGVSVLWGCLRLAGAAPEAVEYYIPHRVEEGYGLNAEAIRRLVHEHQAAVIVTVDCGISAVAEAKLARELGAELIVTDHHTLGPELPEAAVVVHPALPGSRYPDGELCGAGVAFKLAWQVCKSFGDGKRASPALRDYLKKALGLVAMATVADVMPLRGENRLLVRHGLAILTQDPSVGLHALMRVSGTFEKSRKLSAGHVGFNLAPRINAAGRLERAIMAVEMLTTDDAARAGELAEELDRRNRERQHIEQAILDEARAMVEQRGGIDGRGAIVLGREGWHPGVIGIVASRLVDIYHRPTVVVALGEIGQGSARSIPGFHLYQAIQACSEGLLGFGGHAAAAGLKLPRDHFDSFAQRFDEYCRSALTPEQLHKILDIDAEVLLGQLSLRVVEEIESLEPHGIGNPKPLLMATDVRIAGNPKRCGDRQQHLQLRCSQGNVTLKAVAWNQAERAKNLVNNTRCALAFNAEINEWNGRREVQLHIKDFQIEEAGANGSSDGHARRHEPF
jgi:single-stranded-DNA-specific exonuclease